MANVLIGHVKGPKGDAATVSVGTTTTGAAGSSASVTNSGTTSAAVLNFTIPKGDKGDAGTPGVTDYATSSAAGLVRVGTDFNINSSNGTLSINKSNLLEDSLTSTSTSKALTAKQGKTLSEYKLNKGNVVNNFTTTQEGYALDARAGKTLHDALGVLRVVSAMISASGVTTFTVPNNSRLVLYTMTGSWALQGAYIINSTSAGAVSMTEIHAATSLTFDVSVANTIKITNANNLPASAFFLVFGGGVS